MGKNWFFLFLLLPISVIVQANDPTRPPTITSKQGQTTLPAYKTSKQPLTAIITREKQRVAIIEGKLYHRGDYYRNQRILRIDQNSVLLSSNDGNKTLTLIQEIKK